MTKKRPVAQDLTRRLFLERSMQIAGATGLSLFAGATCAPIGVSVAHASGADDFGPLGPPDQNGLRLPAGFSSRVVALTGQAVGNSGYLWHAAPDGGATFELPSGGWVYVSNAERINGNGGVSAIQFGPSGEIEDAYSILSGTNRNCAGGTTPWQHWLSCEEVGNGLVWECDPFAPGSAGIARPAMGRFNHEAAAVDPVHQRVYLTEDRSNGLLYRFTPTSYPDLSSGILEAAEILDPNGEGEIAPGQTRPLTWHLIPDPSATNTATRNQAPAASSFDGGEGCWYAANQIYFATKNDSRVWRLETDTDSIEIIYDFATSPTPELSGADNVYVAPSGDVYVAEDPGDLQIVALTPTGAVLPIVQITGQSGTEVTGPALSPDGTRLYFSSQRNPGTTYEVTGPFVAPPVPVLGGLSHLFLAATATVAGARLLRDKSTSKPSAG